MCFSLLATNTNLQSTYVYIEITCLHFTDHCISYTGEKKRNGVKKRKVYTCIEETSGTRVLCKRKIVLQYTFNQSQMKTTNKKKRKYLLSDTCYPRYGNIVIGTIINKCIVRCRSCCGCTFRGSRM